MKIGFIGLGNMAKAMMGGMIAKKVVAPADVIGSDKAPAMCDMAAEKYGIAVTSDNIAVAKEADMLFLAVKPQFISGVLAEIKEAVSDSTVIISIVAGKSLAFLEAGLGASRKIVRCMPNTPALVGEGCTAVCSNAKVTEEELQTVLTLFESFGTASRVPENLIDAVVGISGSSPAYVFMFIEALADAGVAAGMPRQQAYTFAAQAVLGSAKMVLETGMHPAELKDMVCSPAGTTIEAVKVLEEKGMRAAVIDAVAACVEKSKNL